MNLNEKVTKTNSPSVISKTQHKSIKFTAKVACVKQVSLYMQIIQKTHWIKAEGLWKNPSLNIVNKSANLATKDCSCMYKHLAPQLVPKSTYMMHNYKKCSYMLKYMIRDIYTLMPLFGTNFVQIIFKCLRSKTSITMY